MRDDDFGFPTRHGADVLPLEHARLTALREYISLWERGLGTQSTFVARALEAVQVHGITAKALQLVAPFRELHDDLARMIRAALRGELPRVGKKPSRALSFMTRAALEEWLDRRDAAACSR